MSHRRASDAAWRNWLGRQALEEGAVVDGVDDVGQDVSAEL
jgi:hypothetical protein